MKEIRILIPTPEDLLPDEFYKHMFNAMREFLLAVKCIVDAGIAKIDEIDEIAKEKKEIQKVEIE
ncbi:MAG: hypothetical protein QFX40_08490 [Archaeoglobales archaeon]|nr:hypothetical protein [Archaeoglobales archaeon]